MDSFTKLRVYYGSIQRLQCPFISTLAEEIVNDGIGHGGMGCVVGSPSKEKVN
jgi:hypothetical protein